MIFPEKLATDEEKLKFAYRAKEILRLEHNAKGDQFRDGKVSKDEWTEYVKDFEGRFTNVLYEIATLRDALGHSRVSAKNISEIETFKSAAKIDVQYDVDIDVKMIAPLKTELIEKENIAVIK